MHAYYAYPSDGHSYWGLGLYRNAELPVQVTEQVYKASAKVKVRYLRMKQYAADKKAVADKAAQEAEAKSKAKSVARKK